MALIPINDNHALQIQAGTLGRNNGHEFEDRITAEINALRYPVTIEPALDGNVRAGDPALLLLQHVAVKEGITELASATAVSTGSLATSEQGRKWLEVNGASVSRCKSDLVLTLKSNEGVTKTVGISTKQCNNRTPTNAQLYFTTARGFAKLLSANGIQISDIAINALRQFCGDVGFRPMDTGSSVGRMVDPRRFLGRD